MNKATNKVEFFLTASGSCPVLEHLRSLPQEQRRIVGGEIRRMQDHGVNAPGLHVKVLKGKLCQLTASYQRVIYFTERGGKVWLLHAFQKETQQTPPIEIQIAERRMAEVLARR